MGKICFVCVIWGKGTWFFPDLVEPNLEQAVNEENKNICINQRNCNELCQNNNP